MAGGEGQTKEKKEIVIPNVPFFFTEKHLRRIDCKIHDAALFSFHECIILDQNLEPLFFLTKTET